MQDKMAVPAKVSDTRTELAELVKKRAKIAVISFTVFQLFLLINFRRSLIVSFCFNVHFSRLTSSYVNR